MFVLLFAALAGGGSAALILSSLGFSLITSVAAAPLAGSASALVAAAWLHYARRPCRVRPGAGGWSGSRLAGTR